MQMSESDGVVWAARRPRRRSAIEFGPPRNCGGIGRPLMATWVRDARLSFTVSAGQ